MYFILVTSHHTPAATFVNETMQRLIFIRYHSPVNPGLNFNFNSKFLYFFQAFSYSFWEHPTIKLQAKKFKLNFLLKLSDLTSNSTLTLCYLNLALNNPGQMYLHYIKLGLPGRIPRQYWPCIIHLLRQILSI